MLNCEKTVVSLVIEVSTKSLTVKKIRRNTDINFRNLYNLQCGFGFTPLVISCDVFGRDAGSVGLGGGGRAGFLSVHDPPGLVRFEGTISAIKVTSDRLTCVTGSLLSTFK